MFLSELTNEELEQFTAEYGGNSVLVGDDGMVVEGSSLNSMIDEDQAFARSAA